MIFLVLLRNVSIEVQVSYSHQLGTNGSKYYSRATPSGYCYREDLYQKHEPELYCYLNDLLWTKQDIVSLLSSVIFGIHLSLVVHARCVIGCILLKRIVGVIVLCTRLGTIDLLLLIVYTEEFDISLSMKLHCL